MRGNNHISVVGYKTFSCNGWRKLLQVHDHLIPCHQANNDVVSLFHTVNVPARGVRFDIARGIRNYEIMQIMAVIM